MVTDPVCKMDVDPAKAATKVEYAGQVYYFCSSACHKVFTADLQKYAGSAQRGSHYHGPK